MDEKEETKDASPIIEKGPADPLNADFYSRLGVERNCTEKGE